MLNPRSSNQGAGFQSKPHLKTTGINHLFLSIFFCCVLVGGSMNISTLLICEPFQDSTSLCLFLCPQGLPHRLLHSFIPLVLSVPESTQNSHTDTSLPGAQLGIDQKGCPPSLLFSVLGLYVRKNVLMHVCALFIVPGSNQEPCACSASVPPLSCTPGLSSLNELA